MYNHMGFSDVPISMVLPATKDEYDSFAGEECIIQEGDIDNMSNELKMGPDPKFDYPIKKWDSSVDNSKYGIIYRKADNAPMITNGVIDLEISDQTLEILKGYTREQLIKFIDEKVDLLNSRIGPIMDEIEEQFHKTQEKMNKPKSTGLFAKLRDGDCREDPVLPKYDIETSNRILKDIQYYINWSNGVVLIRDNTTGNVEMASKAMIDALYMGSMIFKEEYDSMIRSNVGKKIYNGDMMWFLIDGGRF